MTNKKESDVSRESKEEEIHRRDSTIQVYYLKTA